MLSGKKRFETEMNTLKDAAGAKSTDRAYSVFAQILKWLHAEGHGKITLSAINHKFGVKLNVETIVNIKGEFE